MKISELMEVLEKIKTEQGDMPVAVQYRVDSFPSTPDSEIFVNVCENAEILEGAPYIKVIKAEKACVLEVRE